jgi:hypothetical protein
LFGTIGMECDASLFFPGARGAIIQATTVKETHLPRR